MIEISTSGWILSYDCAKYLDFVSARRAFRFAGMGFISKADLKNGSGTWLRHSTQFEAELNLFFRGPEVHEIRD